MSGSDGGTDPPTLRDDAVRIAKEFHVEYEARADTHGWETQQTTRVAWDDLPIENRTLMVATVHALLRRGVIAASVVSEQEIEAAEIATLTKEMRANSERWFPRWHDSDALGMPLTVAYALGLSGEVGEVANVVKKLHRDGHASGLGAELADVLTYLLLLADEADVDIVAAYRAKVVVNEGRFGAAARRVVSPETPKDTP